MSRNIRIKGQASVSGRARVPGDKSISHRIAILSSIAEGKTTVRGFASSVDCHATLDCVRRLGINVQDDGESITIEGRGLSGYRPPALPAKLFVGNSGSTIRMISGVL